ncbi:MAG: DUF6036 family nucleotidyltransferase [Armatimonadota bacterium]
MDIQQDFKELLELFNANKVEYVIVGAYALALHGAPRSTGDIDILVGTDKINAERILKALNEFGFGSLNLKVEDFTTPDNIIQLGVAPVRIDIITTITGVSTEDAFSGRIADKYGDAPVYYLGLNEFIENKKALARKKDLADIEALDKLD